ncbi:T9SS type A sorting domain-containing protein, partial [Flavobacteriales bacterium]|nr:T9SS type A sorting domain-containing protein [Flavobacteriales bacterium]
PAKGSVLLSGIAADVNWELTVRTLLGQEVLIQYGRGQSTLDLSRLTAGTYLGQIQTQEGNSLVLRLLVR